MPREGDDGQRRSERRRDDRRTSDIGVAVDRRWLPDRRRGDRRESLAARLRRYFG